MRNPESHITKILPSKICRQRANSYSHRALSGNGGLPARRCINVDRVELSKGSAEFEAAFMLSAKRRRLAPERIDASCTRIRELRENRDELTEANILLPTGLPAAISAVFPEAEIRTCVVQLMRNSLSFCSWKQRHPVARELKRITKRSRRI
jgi:hypothetical protein